MIAEKHIQEVRSLYPWQMDGMIEQDMLINRALISMYGNEYIKNRLVFRGGTALNKLYIQPPSRYSEDIDFVQLKSEPIGPLMQQIMKCLSWLGESKTKFGRGGLKMFYPFKDVTGETKKLKIEINTKEHFHVEPLQKSYLEINSTWFSGNEYLITYSLEELLATKIRALFQRRKGRDLFDIWYTVSRGMVDLKKSIDIFHQYNIYNNANITSKMFLKNLKEKKLNVDFKHDMQALLPVGSEWNFEDAFSYIMHEVVPLISKTQAEELLKEK